MWTWFRAELLMCEANSYDNRATLCCHENYAHNPWGCYQFKDPGPGPFSMSLTMIHGSWWQVIGIGTHCIAWSPKWIRNGSQVLYDVFESEAIGPIRLSFAKLWRSQAQKLVENSTAISFILKLQFRGWLFISGAMLTRPYLRVYQPVICSHPTRDI